MKINNDTDALMEACEMLAGCHQCPFEHKLIECTEDECENADPAECWVKYFRGDYE